MTIEYREKGSYSGGRRNVVTTACGLCGEPLGERKGMADHLPNCPVREIYAERGALRDGGPDPSRIQAALDGRERLVADGGEPS